MKQIKVINYGLSNLLSVQRAFEHLGAQVEFVNTPEGVLAAEALVLPGVGAFKDGMAGLERLGLIEPILQKAAAGTPLLGICLGMQMLFDESDEFGLHKGLGLIPGRVEKIPALDTDGDPQRVPHISWNGLWPAGGRTDFAGTALASVTGLPVSSGKERPRGPGHSGGLPGRVPVSGKPFLARRTGLLAVHQTAPY